MYQQSLDEYLELGNLKKNAFHWAFKTFVELYEYVCYKTSIIKFLTSFMIYHLTLHLSKNTQNWRFKIFNYVPYFSLF